MHITSKLKKLIIKGMLVQIEKKKDFDCSMWDEIAEEISDNFYKVKGLQVKEIFYKEILSSFSQFNYGLSEEMIYLIKKLTRTQSLTVKQEQTSSPEGSPDRLRESADTKDSENGVIYMQVSNEGISPPENAPFNATLDPLELDEFSFTIADSDEEAVIGAQLKEMETETELTEVNEADFQKNVIHHSTQNHATEEALVVPEADSPKCFITEILPADSSMNSDSDFSDSDFEVADDDPDFELTEAELIIAREQVRKLALIMGD